MGKQVYDYKTGQMWGFLAATLMFACFGIGQSIPVAQGLFFGTTPPGPIVSWPFTLWLGFLGLAMLCLGCGMLSHMLNERIVIEGDQVTYTNWRGRTVKCPISGVMAIISVNDRADDSPVRERGSLTYRVLTTGGAFRFYPTIRDFARLVEVLSIGAEQHSSNEVCEVSPPEI